MPILLAFLAGWPWTLLRGAWSALLDAAKTPLGAALIAGCLAYAVGHHEGWTQSEAKHAHAAEIARAVAEARAEVDRETARAEGLRLSADAAARAAHLQEITDAPLPQPRPGEPCGLDTRRLR